MYIDMVLYQILNVVDNLEFVLMWYYVKKIGLAFILGNMLLNLFL